MKHRVLIVGGGYAGVLCALRLVRKASVDVVLVDPKEHFVERIRLHEDVASAPRRRETYAELLAGTTAEHRLGWVTGIDLGARRAHIEGEDLAFDDLVIATGSRATGSDVPGIEHAWPCANEDEALALRARIDQLPDGAVTIVGGGLSGIELAAELAERRPALTITLVTEGDVAPSLSPEARAHIRRHFAIKGVAIRTARVAAIDARSIILANGDEIPSDVTVWCAGLAPSPLPQRLGLPVDGGGRALVDARLRSIAHDFVHVAGDAARHELAGTPLRMAAATAMPMGAFAADDIAREVSDRERTPFSFRFYGQAMSLGRSSGVIQRVDPLDAPLARWISGWSAAWIKEGLCRYTMLGMAAERRGWAYRWPTAPAPRPILTEHAAR